MSDVIRRSLRSLLCLAVALAACPASASAQSSASAEDLTGESDHPLQVSGFGVAGFHADGQTGASAFDAGKLALGLFRELNQHAWFFGQLTASYDAAAPPDTAATSVDIDNLLLNVAPAGSRFSAAVGKFDTPLGFERDDEPLNLQPTTSLNFELARPPKMVGAIGRAYLTSSVDVSAWIANGWRGDLAATHGKTVGGRLGVRPSEAASIGAGFLYGPERGPNGEATRFLATLDYAVQPTGRWIVGGEANWGGDRGTATSVPARWYGATATVLRLLTSNTALTVRGEQFSDPDGARTGAPQSLASIAVAPMYFMGGGGEGIFATVEHTTFRIPRFQLRGEARFDRSTVAVFPTRDGTGRWDVQYRLQLVATF